MIIQARVKRTNETVFLRKPAEGEYLSAIYEPDYIQIDEDYNPILSERGTYIPFDYEDLEDIQYI